MRQMSVWEMLLGELEPRGLPLRTFSGSIARRFGVFTQETPIRSTGVSGPTTTQTLTLSLKRR